MARAYYFDFTHKDGEFKNSEVEANTIGSALWNCAAETFREYGLRFASDCSGKYRPRSYNGNRYRGFFANYRKNGDLMLDPESNMFITVSFTQDYKLFIDFKIDPILPENSNDDIVEDIKKKLIEKGWLPEGSETHIGESENKKSGSGWEAESTSGGCYIATAIYGSYDCPEVWTLRRFRDLVLAQSWYGKCFIKIYYAISPIFVQWFGTSKWFQSLGRNQLNKIVHKLKLKGFDDSPYND